MNNNIFVKIFCLIAVSLVSNVTAYVKGYNWKLVNGGELIVSQTEGPDDQSLPSIIEIPDWVTPQNRAQPTARFYFYYGDHHGMTIKMKWSKSITGPWKTYNLSKTRSGVMDFAQDTNRSQGDNKWKHIAAPDVLIDHKNKRFIMNFHGKMAKKLNVAGKSASDWHRNFLAFSPYGLNFNDPESGGGIKEYGPLEVYFGDLSRTVYFFEAYAKIFTRKGEFYSIGRGGTLGRPRNQNTPWKVDMTKNPFNRQWEIQRKKPALHKNAVKNTKKKKYKSAISTWFASSEFAKHPNNPHPGWIIGKKRSRVNHVGIFKLSDTLLEVFFWVRGDNAEVYGIEDPYRDLYRVVLDMSSSNWDEWDVSRDASGKAIFDIVCTPKGVYDAVKQAIGGGDIDGDTHADPVSMGVPGLIKVEGKLYCFVGFQSEDNSGHDSEGQIVCLELIAK